MAARKRDESADVLRGRKRVAVRILDRDAGRAPLPAVRAATEDCGGAEGTPLNAPTEGKPRFFDPFKKLEKKPNSLRYAITAKCWDCVGRGCDPNPRATIRECPSVGCPLHAVRPWRKPPKKATPANSEP